MSTTHEWAKTVGGIHNKSRWAFHTLTAAKKQAIAAYDEDLRALKNLDLKLSAQEKLQQPELFKIETVLSPEIRQILESPLAKYQ